MKRPVRIALIGAGTMSEHHARVITDNPDARLDVVIDPLVTRAESMARAGSCRAATTIEAALDCDAAIIAATTAVHTDIALPLLAAGLPLLIEKPVSTDLDEVRLVVKESEAREVPVMCGFVERFNPVIATAKAMLTEAPVHMVSLRHSPRTPRATSSVVYDLLIHDIDLAIGFAADPRVTRFHGSTWIPPVGGMHEVADCSIHFGDGMLSTLSASRTSQRKVRSFHIETPDSLVELDLLRQDISVYRHVSHEQVTNGDSLYRAEMIVDIPFVRHAGEPLALQLAHFLGLVRGEADPEAERDGLIAPHEIAAEVAVS